VIDVLLRNGTIHDGSGRAPSVGDVGIDAGRIVAVGRGGDVGRARRVVDATGLVVAPGFIDMHSHADLTLPAYPGATNSISQGITTEVVGNCGFSPAPHSPDPTLAHELRTAVGGLGPDLDWNWHTFGEYLDRLDAAKPAVNCVVLAGHGAIRLATVGPGDRPIVAADREAMARELSLALAAGAWGMSTGLVYPPGSFATTEEIVEIGRPLQRADGLYASHIRSEGDGLLAAVDEAIAVGSALGVRVQISHLKAAGARNHGRVVQAIERIEAARQRTERVSADAYPYTAGSTLLSQLLPPWVLDGGVDQMVARLRTTAVRDRIRFEVRSGAPGATAYPESATDWSGVLVAATVDPALKGLSGSTVAQVASREDADPIDVLMDTLVADRGATTMIMFLMAEEDVERVYGYPGTVIGSDQLGVTGPDTFVHPRSYGTFARVFGTMVRERSVLTVAEAVHKATGLPASILGLRDRGLIRPGMVADLTVFDPATIRDEATYADPTRLASGVQAVLIGGQFAVDDGSIANARLGRVLRRPREA
jgi:N-acyl-D-amino-acid deacylase